MTPTIDVGQPTLLLTSVLARRDGLSYRSWHVTVAYPRRLNVGVELVVPQGIGNGSRDDAIRIGQAHLEQWPTLADWRQHRYSPTEDEL